MVNISFKNISASFEWFRERCSLNSSLEENKDILKEKINEAKTVGERANQSRFHSAFRFTLYRILNCCIDTVITQLMFFVISLGSDNIFSFL